MSTGRGIWKCVNPGECRGWAELLSSVVRLSRHVLTGIYLCWQADVNLECYTPTWAAYATYTIVMLALYTLGLPMFLFVYLYLQMGEVRFARRVGRYSPLMRRSGWEWFWPLFLIVSLLLLVIELWRMSKLGVLPGEKVNTATPPPEELAWFWAMTALER